MQGLQQGFVGKLRPWGSTAQCFVIRAFVWALPKSPGLPSLGEVHHGLRTTAMESFPENLWSRMAPCPVPLVPTSTGAFPPTCKDTASPEVERGCPQQVLHVVAGQPGEPLQVWSRVAQNLFH